LWKHLETVCRNGESQPQPCNALRRRRHWQPQPRPTEGTRDKISTAFLEALNEAFYEPNESGGCKGLDAIKKVRDEDPATFARIYATLLPKQLEIEDTSPEAALSNEQIEEYYAFLSERMAAKAKPAEPSITIAPGPQTVN
jgi:hypothetical protein